jgi:hypothetical protein
MNLRRGDDSGPHQADVASRQRSRDNMLIDTFAFEGNPELESDHVRKRIVLAMLEGFPSIRRDVWVYPNDILLDEPRPASSKK